MKILSYLARRFVAGETQSQALRVVSLLNQKGLLTSLDVLGEDVQKSQDVERYVDEYVSLIGQISSRALQSDVSIKLSQMGLEVGREFCVFQMKRVLDCAQEKKNFVWVDMEGSQHTEATLRVFEELRRHYVNVGVAIQAYLYRSYEDTQLLTSLKAAVRVCKGAYRESPAVAMSNMKEIRANFKRIVEVLLRGGSRVAMATHDEDLLLWGTQLADAQNLSPMQFEFQMLYGLRRRRGRALVANGYQLRSYVPYGTHWLPYFTRRLRERKENIFFVIKSLFAD